MKVCSVSMDCPRDRDDFLRLPMVLHRENPCYIPPLLAERRRFLDPSNPRFRSVEARFYLLRDHRGRAIGRVTAHVNRRHTERTGLRTGYFGFFECIRDREAAAALMAEAEADLHTRGMAAIQGPFSFSASEESGFLAEGFDRPPALFMPYSPPWYRDFIHELGYRPFRRLLALEINSGGRIPDRFARHCERIRARTGVTVRTLDPARFNRDAGELYRLYREVFDETPGGIPMNREEFLHAANTVRPWLDPDLALLIEKNGTPAAFALALPDYNAVLRRMRGKIWPMGWVWPLLRRRLVRRVRIALLGVSAPFRRTGIDTLLYAEIARRCLEKGYRDGEASWIAEDNLSMRRPMERAGARITKRYELFEKNLS